MLAKWQRLFKDCALLRKVSRMSDTFESACKVFKPSPEDENEIDHSTDHSDQNDSLRLKLFNLPKFINPKDLKKKILSCLEGNFSSVDNDLKIKKAPNWNYAYATFGCKEQGNFFLQQLEQKSFVLKKFVVRGEISTSIIEREILPQSPAASEQQIERSILDQVVPLHKLPYEEQLNQKFDEMVSILPKPISSLLTEKIEAPLKEGYRNKNEFSIGRNSKGEPEVGFTMGLYKDGIVAVESAKDCPNVPQSHLQIASFFCNYIRTSSYPPFDRVTGLGYWRILVIRSNQQGEHMIGIQLHPQNLTSDELQTLKEELKGLFSNDTDNSQLPKIASMQLQCSLSKTHGISSKDNFEVLIGSDCIYESLYDNSLKFRISINSFFQVNTPATEKLYETIRRFATLDTTGCTLLDLCCGTGTIGISMAKYVDRVVGVEMVQDAVKDAQFNATINGVSNIEFICSKLEDCIDNVLKQIDPTHSVIVVLDPPRSGVHPSVIRCLKQSSIAARIMRIIYVSCNASLAKDNFESLMQPTTSKNKSYYQPEAAVLIDLFPHTKHSELVVAFKPYKEE